MTCVIALDLASTSGWALWRQGLVKPRAGVLEMPKLDNMGKWAEAFIEWASAFFRLEGVTHAVIEAPIIATHKDEETGKVRLNMHEVRKLVSLVSFAEYAAVINGATFSEVARSTVCAHFAGSGRGKRKELKAACFVRCQQKGWNVTSQDVADALATLDWFCHDQHLPVPWDCQKAPGPLFTGLAGTRIDRSNKVAAAKLLNKALSFSGRQP